MKHHVSWDFFMKIITDYIKNALAFLIVCGFAFWAFLSRQEERERRKRLEDLIKGKNEQIARQMEIRRESQARREQIEKEIEAGKRDFFE